MAICTLSSLALLLPILSTPGWYGGHAPALTYFPLPVPQLPNPVAAAKLALLALMILGGIGAYRLAHCFCRPSTALAVTVLFYLTPYLALQLYERGGLPELAAMLLCPWPFYHLIMMSRLVRHNAHALPSALWLSLSMVAILYAWPMTAAWLAAAFALCTLGRAADTPTLWHVVMIACLAAVFALALTFPHWLPLLETKTWPLAEGDAKALAPPSIPQLFALDSPWAGPILPLLAFIGFCIGIHAYLMAAALLSQAVLLMAVTPLLTLLPVLRAWPLPECALAVLATVQLIGIAFFFGFAEWRQHWRFGWVIVLIVAAVLVFDNRMHYPLRGMPGFEMPKPQVAPRDKTAAQRDAGQYSGFAVTAGALSLLLLWGLCRPRQFHPMSV